MQSLTDVKAGEDRMIKWMFVNPLIQEMMDRYDIKEGSLIRVFQQGRDSMIIGRDQWRLAIGSEIAERIKV